MFVCRNRWLEKASASGYVVAKEVSVVTVLLMCRNLQTGIF